MFTEENYELFGRIGQDAEVKQGQKGDFITFSVAYSYGKKDDRKTVWRDVRTSHGNHLKIASWLTKGRYVRIKGNLSTDAWQDQQTGDIRSKLVVHAFDIQFMDSKPEGE